MFHPYAAIWRIDARTAYEIIVLSEPERGNVRAMFAADERQRQRLDVFSVPVVQVED